MICIKFLNRRFKKIMQRKNIDFQSLVGNSGGYIGLFLGFAVMQIPEMAVVAVITIKKICKGRYHRNLVAIQPIVGNS